LDNRSDFVSCCAQDLGTHSFLTLVLSFDAGGVGTPGISYQCKNKGLANWAMRKLKKTKGKQKAEKETLALSSRCVGALQWEKGPGERKCGRTGEWAGG
jgi:hypothetical protein